MPNGGVSFANAERERIVAHRWIDRHFIFVPGPEKYNLRLIPGVSPDLQFDCDHGRFGTIMALRHLVQRHGGFENLFTAEMKAEAERCLFAMRSFTAATELIERRYRIWHQRGQLVINHQQRRLHVVVAKDALESVSGAPEIQILAKLYGPRLGEQLMGTAVLNELERRNFRRRSPWL